jgi:2-iminobutanoate/2-iminopropanoate deaminase
MPLQDIVRAKPQNYLLFPAAARAGDYVFTSSIYPVGENGEAERASPRLGYLAQSDMEVQTERCVHNLALALRELGSSLRGIIKVDVHLARAQDFYEFKRAWRKLFPLDLPAMTVIEVGECFPVPGALLNIDAVALIDGSNEIRQVLSDPDGSDPTNAEAAVHAVRAGNLVFCSGFTASNFQTGLAVGRLPGFPNYGSEGAMQAEYVFERMNRVLAQAGTSLDQTVETQLYFPNMKHFHDVDTVWGRFTGLPPARAAIEIKGSTVPGAHFVPNPIVLVPDARHKKLDSIAGIPWHPKEKKVNYSPTIKAGDWRFFAGQVSCENFKDMVTGPPDLPNHFSSVEIQTRFVLDMLTRQLEANDTDWNHCIHARVFLTEPTRDYRAFARAWHAFFIDPSRAPAVSFVPSIGTPFSGPLVEIDPTAIARH